MGDTVWLVWGSNDEYEDYTEWVVRAFRTETGANAYCHLLNNALGAAKRVYHETGYHVNFWNDLDVYLVRQLRELDGSRNIDQRSHPYRVSPVPLLP